MKICFGLIKNVQGSGLRILDAQIKILFLSIMGIKLNDMTHKREENELGDIDIKITSQQPLL
jgi:hypothetical protein